MRKFERRPALGLLILLMPMVTSCRQQCEITCNDGYSETTDGRCGITDALRAGELSNERRTACSDEDKD